MQRFSCRAIAVLQTITAVCLIVAATVTQFSSSDDLAYESVQ